jgi:hypothetical protein
VVVDANGKLVRGHGLYQTIMGFSGGVASLTSDISDLTVSTFNVLSDLTTRLAAVEAATPNSNPTQISNRLSNIETLGQKLRARMNGLNLFSPRSDSFPSVGLRLRKPFSLRQDEPLLLSP